MVLRTLFADTSDEGASLIKKTLLDRTLSFPIIKHICLYRSTDSDFNMVKTLIDLLSTYPNKNVWSVYAPHNTSPECSATLFSDLCEYKWTPEEFIKLVNMLPIDKIDACISHTTIRTIVESQDESTILLALSILPRCASFNRACTYKTYFDMTTPLYRALQLGRSVECISSLLSLPRGLATLNMPDRAGTTPYKLMKKSDDYRLNLLAIKYAKQCGDGTQATISTADEENAILHANKPTCA